MRIIVFFDLPTITGEDRRNYRNFRKCLIKNGFIMLQESVYCKMITSPSVEKSVNSLLAKNKPENFRFDGESYCEKLYHHRWK